MVLFLETAQLLEQIKEGGHAAVICDHRLSHTPFASFTGAKLVSEMYRQKITCLLLSTFAAVDGDTSIRRYRAFIPSLVSRTDLDPDRILQGLRFCEDEIAGHIAPWRKPWRTLVRVVSVSGNNAGGHGVADAILHSWNPDCGVRFPLELIEDPQIKAALNEDFISNLRLFAQVNVDCEDDMDLYFRTFEFAPDPNVNASSE